MSNGFPGRGRARAAAALAGFMLAVVGAYTAGSWYAGREAQARIGQLVEQANLGLAAQWPATGLQPVLRIDEYQRGWFWSRIQYTLRYPGNGGLARDIHFDDELSHGPFPWAMLREGDWRPALAHSRLALVSVDGSGTSAGVLEGQAPPLVIQTRIAFDGRVHAAWHLAAGRMQDESADLSFGAGHMTVNYDPATQASTVDGGLDALTLILPETGERMRLEGLSFQGESTFSSNTDGRAQQGLRIRQAVFEMPDSPPVEAIGVVIDLAAIRAHGLVDGRMAYALEQWRIDGRDMGQLEFQAHAERFDPVALGALQREWEQIVADGALDEGLDQQDHAILIERLRPVLATAPAVAIDALRWRNPEGQSQATWLMEFTPPGDEQAYGDVGALIDRAIRQFRFQLDISKAMVVETARRMDPAQADRTAAMTSMLFDSFAGQLARAGLIRVEDGVVRFDLVYGAGQLALNGQDMPVADFFALVSPWLSGSLGLP